MKAAIFRKVPRYSWNIANVGVKHQSINQSIEMYILSCIIIYNSYWVGLLYIFEWILFQNVYRSQVVFCRWKLENIVKPEISPIVNTFCHQKPEICKKYYNILHIE